MRKLGELLSEVMEFKIGDIVYLRTDPEQLERMVYSYTINNREVLYNLTQGTVTSGHFDFEISSERKII